MNTRRTILTMALAAALTGHVIPAIAQSPRRISLEQLEAMFANMRVKTKWNIDGPLLWGYFFFDPNPEKLKRAAAELEASGFRVVNLEAVSGKQVFRLHVERVEAHTPTSLNLRNTEFYEFAEKHSIASYDGMDVGPAPKATQ